MELYLTRIGKTLQRLTVNHAVLAGSHEVTVVFDFINERTVYLITIVLNPLKHSGMYIHPML
jgi:hypothetical protein